MSESHLGICSQKEKQAQLRCDSPYPHLKSAK